MKTKELVIVIVVLIVAVWLFARGNPRGTSEDTSDPILEQSSDD